MQYEITQSGWLGVNLLYRFNVGCFNTKAWNDAVMISTG